MLANLRQGGVVYNTSRIWWLKTHKNESFSTTPSPLRGATPSATADRHYPFATLQPSVGRHGRLANRRLEGSQKL